MTYRTGDTYGTRSRPRFRVAHLGEYFSELMPGVDASYMEIMQWNKAQTWQKLERPDTGE